MARAGLDLDKNSACRTTMDKVTAYHAMQSLINVGSIEVHDVQEFEALIEAYKTAKGEVHCFDFGGRIQTICVEPGDTIVLMSPGRLSQESKDKLRYEVKQAFPQSSSIALFEDGMTVGVLKDCTTN